MIKHKLPKPNLKSKILNHKSAPLLKLFKAKKLRIAVLLGGISTERAISIKSGTAVVEALRALDYPVKVVDVKDTQVKALKASDIDIAFIVLHGKFGEDGGIQKLLEQRGILYTGSGPESSYRTMDKYSTKECFLHNNIPTAPYRKITKSHSLKHIASLIKELGNYPVVIKPRSQGSSVGVSIVQDAKQLATALKQAFKHEPDALIEQYIKGSELTVGILGQTPLPIIELKPKRAFYDYTAKYGDSGTEYIVNPDLPAKTIRALQSLGLKAHNALGCRVFSRVDIIYSADKEPFVLEANSIPGMTDHSLVPKAAKAVGIAFPQLCERIIELTISN